VNESKPSAEPQAAPATFSLRGLFLFATSMGVASLGFRIANNAGEGIPFAIFLAGTFLTLWFLATRQFNRMRPVLMPLVVGMFVSLFMPSTPTAHESARRAVCQNNLKQIGIALCSYHQKYGSFPPAYVADANGKPLYSWRVLILPFLGQGNLRNTIRNDEAWNGPNNVKVTNTVVRTFDCPDDPQLATPSPAFTSYVAVVGHHTAWAGATPRKLSDFKSPGNTILVIEAANSGIQWAEPRDLHVGETPLTINPPGGQGISSDHPAGVNAVFADGSVHFLRSDVDPKKLAELLDLDGCSDPSVY
jgi:prepilin-type processing-associated H-X9-DG protein